MSGAGARKLAVALAVSVGLNLFLSGMIASAWLVKRDRPDRPPAAGLAGDFDFRGGFRAVGQEARPIAREIRRTYGPRIREAGRAVHETRREIGRMLQADPLDPAALAAAFADLRAKSDTAQAVMHEVMIETMTRLTPEQRRAFLEAAMHRRGPRPNRAGGGN